VGFLLGGLYQRSKTVRNQVSAIGDKIKEEVTEAVDDIKEKIEK